MHSASFAPYEDLAELLMQYAAPSDDGGHDIAHIHRVFRNALRIHQKEGGNGRILAAAVLLHDCVSVEKNSPLRTQASRLAAEMASEILSGLGWAADDISAVYHAVITHSFSANLTPETLEAKILQDADRLDAIGIIGAARCFYTAGRMGAKIYNSDDPLGLARPLDDRTYALDHFDLKLLRLSDGFQTETGKHLANERHKRLEQLREMLLEEI